MSSATKTLELLSYFSPTRPEIGLSQLCRIAGRDKATTYRHLQSLEAVGFVEQNPVSRSYRLGPALLQLAQTREQTVPRKQSALPSLSDLANATGETAHVSVLSGATVYALASCESPRHAARAIVDMATFPLHATASGLCVLAFGPKNLFDIAAADLDSFTPNTVSTRKGLETLIQSVRATGFGYSDQGYEPEIQGLSAPVFDQSGLAGAVAVASVATRFTTDLEHAIKVRLVTASRAITRNWGGAVPKPIETAWAISLSHPHALEPT